MRVLPAWSKACPATRSWQSTCRSACPTSPARAGADPRRWCGRCSASASRASSRSRRAPPSMPRRSRSRRSSSGTRRIGRRADGAPDIAAAARRVDPGLRHLREDPRDRCPAAERAELRQARHRIASGGGVLAAQRRPGDALAEEGERHGQPAGDGRASRRCSAALGWPANFSSRRRRAVLPRTTSSMPARCCSSQRAMRAGKRGHFQTRPARTAMALRWRSGRDGRRAIACGSRCTATLIAAVLCFSSRSWRIFPSIC